MKNNFLNFRIIFVSLISIIFFHNTLFSKELNLKAIEVLTYEEGNIIIGNKDVEAELENEVKIFADKITYNKKKVSLLLKVM